MMTHAARSAPYPHLPLRVLEPSDRQEPTGSITICDEADNDVAEFLHRDQATVGQTYEEALALAHRFVLTANFSAPSATPVAEAGAGVRERPLTASALADAFECFWNASLGAQQAQSSPVSCMAEGIQAVAVRLREGVTLTPSETPADTDLTDEDRIAYWKGAFDRMAARNIEIEARLAALTAPQKV